MRIRPNDKFIEIFAQKFHYFEDSFYKFFALNLLFQGTSYSHALKYSIFLFKFFSFAFYNVNFCSKSVKFAQKFRIFLKFFTLREHCRWLPVPYNTKFEYHSALVLHQLISLVSVGKPVERYSLVITVGYITMYRITMFQYRV